MRNHNTYTFEEAKSGGLLYAARAAEHGDALLSGDLVGFEGIDRGIARRIEEILGDRRISQIRLVALLGWLQFEVESARVFVRSELDNLSDEPLTIHIPAQMAVEISPHSYEPESRSHPRDAFYKDYLYLTTVLAKHKDALARYDAEPTFPKFPANYLPVVYLDHSYILSLEPLESLSLALECAPGPVREFRDPEIVDIDTSDHS